MNLNRVQQEAVQIAAACHNLFITGGIGTGKTKTVSCIVEHMQQISRNIAVTASTGLASLQIKGI